MWKITVLMLEMNGQSADSVFSSCLTKEGNSFVITLITRRKEKQTDCLQDVQVASSRPVWPQTSSSSLSRLFSSPREWFQQCPSYKVVMKSDRDGNGSKRWNWPQVLSPWSLLLAFFLSSYWGSHFGVRVFNCQSLALSRKNEGAAWED